MNKTVVVTGAASGLGRVIATALLAQGHPVILLDRDRESLNAVRAELGSQHEAAVSQLVADLSTVAGVRAAGAELNARPDLDVLVNNAGGWLPGDQYPEAAAETWLSALPLNLVAPTLLTQLLWPRLARIWRRQGRYPPLHHQSRCAQRRASHDCRPRVDRPRTRPPRVGRVIA